MEDREYKVYMEARLRNLKRKYAKLLQHADLLDETEAIGREIKLVEAQITKLQ